MTASYTPHAVIGAGYGDEGKGLMTDKLAARAPGGTLVIRFNGGAQAGHTVALGDGRRHVFSHVASGSLRGARTYLSRYFVSNPLLFAGEWEALAQLGITPQVYVDPYGLVSTPYDMALNQIAEAARGSGRHGSCGIGFGETIERNLDPACALTVADLEDPDALRHRLERIRDDYVPRRLCALGLLDWRQAPRFKDALTGDGAIDRYLEDAAGFLARTCIAGGDVMRHFPALVFEGAQGLLLDQDRGAFPHVTRSNTGLKNVMRLAAHAGLDRLDVTYVTRAYVTRHGAGPLSGELAGPPAPGVRDATNRPNAYQGSLRFAHLDLRILQSAIAADLSDAPDDIAVSHGLAVTCLDQLDRAATYLDGPARAASPEALAAAAAQATGARWLYRSHGPTAADVECHGAAAAAAAAA